MPPAKTYLHHHMFSLPPVSQEELCSWLNKMYNIPESDSNMLLTPVVVETYRAFEPDAVELVQEIGIQTVTHDVQTFGNRSLTVQERTHAVVIQM